jgi:DNA-binding MarR family transcriptional regulator
MPSSQPLRSADAVAVSHISRHLVSVASAVRRAVSSALRGRGHDLTESVTHLVPNLPAEGLGMSALAERAGQSLQRTGQLVQQLEADGYVERIPDENDGRARRVVYTRRGQKLLQDIDALMEQVNADCRAVLGEVRFDQLLQDLAALDAALNGPDAGVRVVADRR